MENLAQQLQATHGLEVASVVADLSQKNGVARASEAIFTLPRVELVVNNAGTMLMGSTAETSTEQVDSLLRVNVDALVHLSIASLKRFKGQTGGTLVNVGSVLGFAGYPGTTAYSATKAFVLSFTEGLQAEYAGSEIRIQLVAPAGVATEGWDSSVVDPSIVMSARECVAASLKSLDMGEEIALPSVEDLGLLANYVAASRSLMGAAQTGTPASRYRS